jgi:rare lipoprotein A
MKPLFTWCVAAVGLLLLGSCEKAPEPWSETGQASFYSVKTNKDGTTASGEPLNDKALTAAHRTLPFNSMVQVTNLQNQQSVTVQIIDRGPFTEGRIIDVSLAAAEALGMTEAGIVPVKIVLVDGAH